MPRRFPERIHRGNQESIRDGITRTKGFLTLLSQTKIGEHLKVKTLQARRKSAIAEKPSKAREEKNN